MNIYKRGEKMNYKYYTSNNNGQDDYGLKYINEEGYGKICKDYKIEFPPQHQDKQPRNGIFNEAKTNI